MIFFLNFKQFDFFFFACSCSVFPTSFIEEVVFSFLHILIAFVID